MADLSRVTIGVSSFLRHGYLDLCLKGIESRIPECPVIVVDDSEIKPQVPSNVELIILPFDSGLPAKRNASVKACKTEYWLCGCDDYDHSTQDSRNGLEKMVKILDENPEITVAGGRFRNNPYEGNLTLEPGSHIKETWLEYNGEPFQYCDLMANYFVARTDDIRPFLWDERMKIGGEHGDWFLTLKDSCKKVVWCKDVSIDIIPHKSNLEDPRYGRFRGRAANLGHKIFMEKRGIKKYLGFND